MDVSFSIIMSTYNRKYCIKNAIESILIQTYNNFELIIIDDGSTDDTYDYIIKSFRKEIEKGKIKLLQLNKNRGASFARNEGLKVAKNDWIGYLDSDNKMHPDFLESFVNSINKNKNNKLFYAQIKRINSNEIIGQDFDFSRLLVQSFIDLGIFVHSIEVYNRLGGFDIKLNRLIDWDFIIRCTEKYEPIFIKKILLDYNDSEEFPRISMQGSYLENYRKIMFNFYERNFNKFFDKKFIEENKKVYNYCLQEGFERRKNKEDIDKENHFLKLKDEELELIKKQLISKNNELLEVYNSYAWKVVLFVRKMLKKIFPIGSFRRKIAVTVFRFFERKFFPFFKKPNFYKKWKVEFLGEIKNFLKHFFNKSFLINYNFILNKKYKENENLYSKLFDFVEPYAIYFPQFHFLEENRKTFYAGYHDMINLRQAKDVDRTIETPLKKYLGFYNLKDDSEIIEKQILTARAYGFKGFGVYYYWFSHNTVTGNNMLMKEVIDKFFKNKINNFDIFFIYANEDWTGNSAFNQHESDTIIKNDYSKEEIIKNFNNLITYFKHDNYKKINNKPILFIHHTWKITQEELKLFYDIGDKIMKENGFSGLELVTNGMRGNLDGYKNYSHHPNHKEDLFNYITIENGVRYFDYDKYVNDYVPSMPSRSNNIQEVFYNFNNIVRYFNHKDRQHLVTKTKNNNVNLFKKFLTLQLDTYNSKNKVSKIFLINSWNEWGEQMAIEPSNEFGFKLLDAFNDVILTYAKREKDNIYKPVYPFLVSQYNSKSPFMFEREFGEGDISVILHLYYTEMWNDIKEKLKNIPYKYTLIVSLVKDHYLESDIEKIKSFNPKTIIFVCDNKGMDILPFLKCLKFVPPKTKFLLKIHTKKSLYDTRAGKLWFDNLVEHVLPEKRKIDMILQNLEYTDIGMIGGSAVLDFKYAGIFDSSEYYEQKIEMIYKYFKTAHTSYKWVSGSMFWVRFDIINKFSNKFIDFFEKKQPLNYFRDGTIAHGLERYFGKMVYDSGKIISPEPIQRYSKNYITMIPEKMTVSVQKDIYLFFNICCVGDYIDVVSQLYNSIYEAGLYDESIKIFYTILGKPSKDFLKWLESLKKFECIHRSNNIKEVEYPTLIFLQNFCIRHDIYLMYFHTKGVSDSHNKAKILWRERLIQKTIYEYKKCISLLDKGCDVAGCGWKEHPYDESVKTDYTCWTRSHFSGNFWWAKSTYIKTLPNIKIIKNNYKKYGRPRGYNPSDFDLYRVACEMWLGMGKTIKVGVNGDINKEYSSLEELR